MNMTPIGRMLLALPVAGMILAGCEAGAQSAGQEPNTPVLTSAADDPQVSKLPTLEATEETPRAFYLDDTISLQLVAPEDVRQHHQLTGLDVIMTNHGEEPFNFYYSGDVLGFQVLNDGGEVVWYHPKVFIQPLITSSLAPGDSAAISRLDSAAQPLWDLRDAEGFPVDPGEYRVKGIMNVSLQDPSEGPGLRIETAAHSLIVKEGPLPEYARAIELTLNTPAEVRQGDPIPLDMHISNTGEKPLVLHWSGSRISPPPNEMDIVVFQEDKSIYRASIAHGIEYNWDHTLGAGESIAMSAIDFDISRSRYEDTGEPWELDQIEPGTYVVRGMVTVSPSDRLDLRATVATEPHELVITPAG